MKTFEPLDWEFYVTKWNNQRRKGENIDKISDNNLPDEGEPSTNSDSDKKEEQKKEEIKEEKKEEKAPAVVARSTPPASPRVRSGSLVGSPRLVAPPVPEPAPAEGGLFDAGDYCDEIPAHLLYAEEPAVVDPPPVAAEEAKSVAASNEEVDEPDE